MNAEHRATDLQHDLRLLEKLSSDALRAMADTQKEMSQVQVIYFRPFRILGNGAELVRKLALKYFLEIVI
jgi:hypothetical protein